MPSFLHYFLRRAGIRIDLLRLRAVYDRHPLPHSIRSLSDTLDELCIPNMICRLEFDQLSELDGPFLVVSGNAEYPFQLVERLDPETRTVHLRTADNRLIDETFDRFRSAWDGSVLTIDRGRVAGLPVAGKIKKPLPKQRFPSFPTWSGRLDSNQRPPTPEAGALTGLRYTPNCLFFRRSRGNRIRTCDPLLPKQVR